MNGQRLTFFSVLIAVFGLSLCQTIISKPYNQSESDSRCKDGLISDIDTVVFKYEIDLKNAPTITDVYFQTRKMDDKKYNFLCHINMTAQCNHGDEKDICVCRILKDYVMEIKVSIKVHISFNGASLRGNIVNQKTSHQIRSEEIWFPKIYESSNSQGQLTINGKEISDEDKCYEHVRNSDLMIKYSCISQAVPCVIEISTDESTQTVQGNGTVIYYEKFNMSKEITATIKHAACTLIGKKRITHCKIKIDVEINFEKDTPLPDKDGMPVEFYITIILIGVSLLTINGILFAFLLLKKLKIGSRLSNFKRRFIYKNRKWEQHIKKEETVKLITTEECDIWNAGNPLEEFNFCKQNPDHASFKSTLDLKLNDLPSGYRDNDIFKLIKTMADLTVLVTVKDGDKAKSAFTGFVGNVVKYKTQDKKKCPCNKCNQTKSATHTWGEIFIYTAALINFDPKTIQCRMFFEKSNDDIKTIDGYDMGQVDVNGRKCQIKCVTCDVKLLHYLMGAKQSLLNINSKINRKCKYLKEDLKLSGEEKRLTIIVSHIHGAQKYVSFGHWIERTVMHTMNGNIELTKYMYTNPTCPGSAGAYVYILGCDHGGWLFQHHHIGINNEGFGFSGHGIDLV